MTEMFWPSTGYTPIHSAATPLPAASRQPPPHPTGPRPLTGDTWRTLIEAPISVAAGVAAGGTYGKLRAYREWGAFVQATRHPDATFAESPLVRAVLAGLHSRSGSQKPHRPIFNVGPDIDRAEVRATALAACRDVAVVLAGVPPAEADTFRRWLVAVAESVAASATDGSFLGVGGHGARPDEQAMVRVIAETLGVAEHS
jgi:hypothetical protein